MDSPAEAGWDDEFYLTSETQQTCGPYIPYSDKTQNDNILIEKHVTPGYRLQKVGSKINLTVTNWGLADKVCVYRRQGHGSWKKAGVLSKGKRRTFSSRNGTGYAYRIRACTKI